MQKAEKVRQKPLKVCQRVDKVLKAEKMCLKAEKVRQKPLKVCQRVDKVLKAEKLCLKAKKVRQKLNKYEKVSTSLL